MRSHKETFDFHTGRDLKLEYKPGSDYCLGQTLSWLEAKKKILRNKEPSTTLASGLKISLLSL